MRMHAIVLSVFTPITLVAQGQPANAPPHAVDQALTAEIDIRNS